MGVALLQRTPRGVRPTAAGEVLFREASLLLKELEQLPGLLTSGSGEAEGKVSLGFATSVSGSDVRPLPRGMPRQTSEGRAQIRGWRQRVA